MSYATWKDVEKFLGQMDQLARPSYIFKPSLHKLKDGKWVAKYGDVEAEGDSPFWALYNFDEIFKKPYSERY
jgi:hypothetical protein